LRARPRAGLGPRKVWCSNNIIAFLTPVFTFKTSIAVLQLVYLDIVPDPGTVVYK
jgi:hypothetical protein